MDSVTLWISLFAAIGLIITSILGLAYENRHPEGAEKRGQFLLSVLLILFAAGMFLYLINSSIWDKPLPSGTMFRLCSGFVTVVP